MGLTKAGLYSGVVVISSGRNSGILLYMNEYRFREGNWALAPFWKGIYSKTKTY